MAAVLFDGTDFDAESFNFAAFPDEGDDKEAFNCRPCPDLVMSLVRLTDDGLFILVWLAEGTNISCTDAGARDLARLVRKGDMDTLTDPSLPSVSSAVVVECSGDDDDDDRVSVTGLLV